MKVRACSRLFHVAPSGKQRAEVVMASARVVRMIVVFMLEW